MTRKARKLSGTGIYHVMLRGNERKDIFRDDEDKQRFLDGIDAKRKDAEFTVYAYCLMDNHAHLIINSHEQDIGAIIKSIAVRYATYYNWKQNRVGHVFQDRFKSEPIEDDQYLIMAIRYIHNNPVKAHLVENPACYRWSSYSAYLTTQAPTWLDIEFVLNIIASDRNAALKEFQRIALEADNIRFIDIEEEKAVRTIEEGRKFLSKLMREHYEGWSVERVKGDTAIRTEIIRQLRSETKLSQRVIAALLGINKGIVEKVKTD